MSNKSLGFLHMDFFLKIIMKKVVLNIQLVNRSLIVANNNGKEAILALGEKLWLVVIIQAKNLSVSLAIRHPLRWSIFLSVPTYKVYTHRQPIVDLPGWRYMRFTNHLMNLLFIACPLFCSSISLKFTFLKRAMGYEDWLFIKWSLFHSLISPHITIHQEDFWGCGMPFIVFEEIKL